VEYTAYKRLAERLDALPNGFPPTEDGVELRLLASLFTPEEADLAAQLRLTPESVSEIGERLNVDPRELRNLLKGMARKGLITARRGERGMAFAIMPFVVGIYEMQAGSIDADLAEMFEAYYRQAFGRVLTVRPQVHRVVPVGQTVRSDTEVQPFESAAQIVDNARAWGVLDCICRVQKALVGDPCDHPVDVCMAFSETPGAFDHSSTVRALTRDQAMATLRRAAEAGLVHSVSNTQQGMWYICNCCTCSCGVLRGMADLGIANVIARSAFVNTVDTASCIACGECVEACPFEALSLGRSLSAGGSPSAADGAQVDDVRCVGCGVCVLVCPVDALSLVRRPEGEVMPPPVAEEDWLAERARQRGLDLAEVL
jgi:electron transport complex protein RnfB